MHDTRPNIIYILADDMGYGDMRANFEGCRIPTPHLDRLSDSGMRFTDAHATSAVCTPSRYSILTGRYCWRSRLKKRIVWAYDGALLEPGRPTVASFLHDQGYSTICIGKWHLGWDWPTHDGRHPNETLPFGHSSEPERQAFAQQHIDFSGRIRGGPIDHGFDSYFGVDVPDFSPYTWFKDDRLDHVPDSEKPKSLPGRRGPAIKNWSMEAMIPACTEKAINVIEDAGENSDSSPFFLYFALTSPHTPIVPNPPFLGKSGIGGYGDFVCEVDWVVGQVMEALERAGISDNTLLIFTSDNGPERCVLHDPHGEGAYTRAERTGHFSMGPLRGIKRDIWEGGHRVPFIASLPGTIPANTVCDQLVGLQDFFATCCELLNESVPEGAAEDSCSFLPMLRGKTQDPIRGELVCHSAFGKFALRSGEWVYIDAPDGNENEEPEWFKKERGYTTHEFPGELFNLREDISERNNRYGDNPHLASEMKARLAKIREPINEEG